MKIIITIAFLGLLLLPGNALPAGPVGQVPVVSNPLGKSPESPDMQAVQRWQQLSPEQQQALRERYRQ